MTTATSGEQPTGDQRPSPADILQKARELIATPEQWGQRARIARETFDTRCAAEAIEDAGPWPFRRSAFSILREAAGLPDEWGALVEWNDAPERTHAEVLAAFDRAIELAKATAA